MKIYPNETGHQAAVRNIDSLNANVADHERLIHETIEKVDAQIPTTATLVRGVTNAIKPDFDDLKHADNVLANEIVLVRTQVAAGIAADQSLARQIDDHESELEQVLDAQLAIMQRVDSLAIKLNSLDESVAEIDNELHANVDDNFIQLTITATEAARLSAVLSAVEGVPEGGGWGGTLSSILFELIHSNPEAMHAYSTVEAWSFHAPRTVRIVD